ncbi:MAG TPA: hypothetical protein VHC92_13075 [Rhodanobacteraceae bacterium]|jgi:hypothetical protein|nr:hypothetical protein [Rhodanobacteraceae bacterium]
MSDTEPTPGLPLDGLLAAGADVGAWCVPHSNRIVLSKNPIVKTPWEGAPPLNLSDLPFTDQETLSQPPSGDLSDFRNALGAVAARTLFDHRRAHEKNHSDRRIGPEVLSERERANDAAAWREVARASADLAMHEGQVLGETRAHLSVGAAADASEATSDAEIRGFLRALSSEARLNAMRQDPTILRAALRSPVLAGLSDAEKPFADAAWRRHRDAADPATAARIAEAAERCKWARGAINSCAKVLASETTTKSEEVLRAVDMADCERISRLVAIDGANKFFLRAA